VAIEAMTTTAFSQHAATQPLRTADQDKEILRLRKLAKTATQPAKGSASKPAEPTGVAALRREASSMELLVQSDLARRFIEATVLLPTISPRTLYRTNDRTKYYTQQQADKLSADQRQALTKLPVDESVYYTTKYGTPLAYARPLDLLGAAGIRDAK